MNCPPVDAAVGADTGAAEVAAAVGAGVVDDAMGRPAGAAVPLHVAWYSHSLLFDPLGGEGCDVGAAGVAGFAAGD